VENPQQRRLFLNFLKNGNFSGSTFDDRDRIVYVLGNKPYKVAVIHVGDEPDLNKMMGRTLSELDDPPELVFLTDGMFSDRGLDGLEHHVLYLPVGKNRFQEAVAHALKRKENPMNGGLVGIGTGDCNGCGECVKVCPEGAISMEREGPKQVPMVIRAELCTGEECGALCKEACIRGDDLFEFEESFSFDD